MLSIELERLRDKRNELSPGVRGHVHELQKQASELATDIQILSHELHSSKLDYLGVARAMAGWCKELGEKHKLEIDFTSHDAPTLPQEISLCLYRVLQESVHNAIKHSGVKRIEAQLAAESGEVQLIVTDSGRGFDPEIAMRGPGLGLTSMRERVRLVGGTIDIESMPTGGTTIRVRVPLESRQSQRA